MTSPLPCSLRKSKVVRTSRKLGVRIFYASYNEKEVISMIFLIIFLLFALIVGGVVVSAIMDSDL